MKGISILTMIRIEQVEWAESETLIRPIRQAVFIDEQHVPVELEWDGLDEACWQLLAMDGDTAVGTARMNADGKIGRVAVLKSWRGLGVGRQLLTAMVEIARNAEYPAVMLAAQIRAIPFYQRIGFEAVGAVFMDAGIAHRKMVLPLNGD